MKMDLDDYLDRLSDEEQTELFADFVISTKFNPYSESSKVVPNELLRMFSEWITRNREIGL